MASFILPNQDIQKILNDPFAIAVFTEHKTYTDPNRFFSHLFISVNFKTFPFIFQIFVNPIDSIYLSCAIIKTVVQVLIIYFLASIICVVQKIYKKILLASILITPLFQSSGYAGYMGIIDQSISYFFFYALPFCLLLIFFRPFFFHFVKMNPFPFLQKLY